MKIPVVLADDHVSIRQMLCCVLKIEGGYEVKGEAKTGLEALRVCREQRPRILIVDLMLPELCGAEVVRQLRGEDRDLRVLVYTGTMNADVTLTALRARPHAFVQKEDTLETLREALRAVASGASYLTPFATRVLDAAIGRDDSTLGRLSPRESAVLQMIAEGLSTKEMAARLSIAPKTAEHHRAHVMEKLDIHDVASLTRFAVRHGLIGLD